MPKFPSIFISHGAPNLGSEPSPAREFLLQLGDRLSQQLDKPEAILCVSAHWSTIAPTVSAASQPQTIYDFAGFAPELYKLQYQAPGSPEVADRVHCLLNAVGIDCQTSSDRGLDHGAWVPLMLAYPLADIPVLQLSVQPRLDAAHHLAVGRALEKLRGEGILIVGSGSATHNLWEISTSGVPVPDWVQEFDRWLHDAVIAGDIESLVQYQHLAPHAMKNHPTTEHLLPLFVALGAGGSMARGKLLHSSFTYSVLSMAAYLFD